MHAIIDPDPLEQFIDAQRALVDESKVHLDDDGLRVTAVDPANVGMVRATLDSGAFEAYEADGGLIGVNLGRLADVVGMADDGDLIRLELDAETRKLHIEVGALEYTLALIGPDSIRQEPDFPELDLPADIRVEARDLDRAATVADLCADRITFGADDEARVFYAAAAGDTDDARLEWGDDDLIDARVDEAVSSLFSLDYIEDVCKPMAASTEVRIELGDEFPAKFHYEYADGRGQITNRIAPRVESG